MTKERFEEILSKTDALLNGHFVLTSGLHASKYMQCARLLEDPKILEEIVEDLSDYFKEKSATLVIGPATGGIILAYELARQLNIRSIFTERVNGKMTLRRGFEIKESDKVLIIEDVVSTGSSVKEVIKIVENSKAKIVGVALLVDRTGKNVDFGYETKAVYQTKIEAFEKKDCPLCKEGLIEAISLGSRSL